VKEATKVDTWILHDLQISWLLLTGVGAIAGRQIGPLDLCGRVGVVVRAYSFSWWTDVGGLAVNVARHTGANAIAEDGFQAAVVDGRCGDQTVTRGEGQTSCRFIDQRTVGTEGTIKCHRPGISRSTHPVVCPIFHVSFRHDVDEAKWNVRRIGTVQIAHRLWDVLQPNGTPVKDRVVCWATSKSKSALIRGKAANDAGLTGSGWILNTVTDVVAAAIGWIHIRFLALLQRKAAAQRGLRQTHIAVLAQQFRVSSIPPCTLPHRAILFIAIRSHKGIRTGTVRQSVVKLLRQNDSTTGTSGTTASWHFQAPLGQGWSISSFRAVCKAGHPRIRKLTPDAATKSERNRGTVIQIKFTDIWRRHSTGTGGITATERQPGHTNAVKITTTIHHTSVTI